MQTVQLVTLVKILLVHCLCHHIDIIYLLMCLGFCPSTVYGSPNVWQLGDHVSSREGIRPWGNSWRVSRANLRWLIISIVWTCDLLHYMHIWIPLLPYQYYIAYHVHFWAFEFETIDCLKKVPRSGDVSAVFSSKYIETWVSRGWFLSCDRWGIPALMIFKASLKKARSS